jgi:hypothetical protein
MQNLIKYSHLRRETDGFLGTCKAPIGRLVPGTARICGGEGGVQPVLEAFPLLSSDFGQKKRRSSGFYS